ncbi:MAG: VacB/RNase II family 3'-5' exoribonuclease [Planctomycetota bacterium]
MSHSSPRKPTNLDDFDDATHGAVLRHRNRLLAHLSHDRYEPAEEEALATDLKVMDRDEFGLAVKALAELREISVSDTGRVALPSLRDRVEEELEGEFRGTQKGFGFVRFSQKFREGDLFVPPDSTLQALTGDRVTVRVFREEPKPWQRGRGDGGPRYVGVVTEVLTRKRSSFSGTIEKRGNQFVVMPDARELNMPISVRDAESKYAKPGDKVVFELTRYPDGDYLGEGVIVRVLGEAGEPDVETQAVIAAYALASNEFSDECVEQARAATEKFDREMELYEREGIGALDMREDLTGELITTIDPPDAKDYDDAISIKRTDDGGWELGVHIADVSHYVEPGTPLDEEASRRGNSTYLPRLVIPMLPEVLSNGICSLQEGVLRYAKSAFIRLDKSGRVRGRRVASTLIKSRKRMTYLEAQALIDGDEELAKEHARTEPNYTPEILESLQIMNECARAIERRRHGQGMISLELPDVELVFDDNGKVIDGQPEDDAYTHKIIEMFMVEANEVLGGLFEELGVPLIRRIHPEPTPGNVEDMQQTASVAGFKIPKSPTREELQGLLDATRGTAAARAVHMAVLRTLTKAEYSPALIGHFALASPAYAHFTSPIRRYADLTVHRALLEFLRQTNNGTTPPKGDEAKEALGKQLAEKTPDEKTLAEIGRSITATEVNSAEAEVQLRKFLILQLLSNKIGEVYDGVVTGVAPKGVFVQIDRFVIDGMVKTSDLPGDVTRGGKPPRWRIDKKTGALVDENSGRNYNVGHRVKVQIGQVNLEARQLDLLIADAEGRSAGKAIGLKLGGGGGGLDASRGGGFGDGGGGKGPGGQRRNRKSKARDRGKTDYRRKK